MKAMKRAYLGSAAREAIYAAGGYGQLAGTILGDISEAYVNAQFSQAQESKADDFGFQFSVEQGRDPYGMCRSLEKLNDLAGGTQSSTLAKMFSSHPDSAKRAATWYALQHLGTEGQGFEGQKDYYSLCNVAIPFGLGIRFNFAKYCSIGAEWGMRFTFTDYLDDVSSNYYDNQTLREMRGGVVAYLADKSDVKHEAGTGRGNSTTKDFYSFAGVVFTFKFGQMDRSCDIRTNVKRKAVTSHN